MRTVRRAGVLLHPTSLPGPYGIGEIGPIARELLAWLETAGHTVWQVLPVNPIDAIGSPYASPSAFAAEPLLLSMDDLVSDGWLLPNERAWVPGRPDEVDYPAVAAARRPALMTAADRVRAQVDLDAFQAAHPWVGDWVLFRALQDRHGQNWTRWPAPLRHRDPAALSAAGDEHAADIGRYTALQWLFAHQWQRLREEATRRGIALWGDMPYFVGLQSCDVWANPTLFRLEDDVPPVVSGVPPDAFSPVGQLWGHPLYDEAAHTASAYGWWKARAAAALTRFDAVRIDHFRGVQAVWEVPADAEDAREGRWIDGPGAPLLEALGALGSSAFIAEDLGVIDEHVRALRDRFELPGMAVLQFAFGAEPGTAWYDNPHLPHNHRRNQVVYTGTHDNDTTAGWYGSADPELRDRLRRYLQVDDHAMPWALLCAAWRSVADTAIVPMQDLLGLDSSARFNTPGRAEGNWRWRMGRDALSLPLAKSVAEQLEVSGRLPSRAD